MTVNASIVIIGRPNVGKSTLINRILKRNKSITFDEPGVTRDILEYPATWRHHRFRLIDTGGVFFDRSADILFQTDIEALVHGAMEKASRIILLTDGKNGIHPMDVSIANQLRAYRAKVCVAVNKIDGAEHSPAAAEFYQLGFGAPFPISATHGTGIDSLLGHCVKDFQRLPEDDGPEPIKVGIIGRPNVGKSSLINALLNQERVIVSDQAGTTRDAVEIAFSVNHQRFTLIDTAGLKKAGKTADGVEFYSSVRTKKTATEAHICIVVLDASDLLREQDKRILDMVLSVPNRLIVFVNKYDLAKQDGTTKDDIRKRLTMTFPLLENYPIIIGSAAERDHITKLIDLVPQIINDGQTRISTPEFNQFITDVIKRFPPPARGNRPIKVYYGTQVGTYPPEFVLFVNHPELIHSDYERYVEKRLRMRFPYYLGTPLRIKFKDHKKPLDVESTR
jgi:GTP-binding protein